MVLLLANLYLHLYLQLSLFLLFIVECWFLMLLGKLPRVGIRTTCARLLHLFSEQILVNLETFHILMICILLDGVGLLHFHSFVIRYLYEAGLGHWWKIFQFICWIYILVLCGPILF